MRKLSVGLVAVVLGVAGCSTAPVVPDVANFGKTVSAIGSADAKSPQAKSLPGRVAAARRADFAANNVIYALSDPSLCAYTGQQLNLTNVSFAEQCQLVPTTLDAGGETVIAASEYDSFEAQEAAGVVIPASNETLLQEHLGHGIRRDLIDYANALNELATTNEPAKLGTSVGSAFNALTGLRDTVSAAARSDGKPAPASQLRAPAKSLFSLVATEVAETMRYRRLKALVEYADPFVQEASVQLTVLTYREVGLGFEQQSDTLANLIFEVDPGNSAGLEQIETAHAALLSADEKAKFRAYSGIGNAHAAIRAALNAPQDLSRIADANARIVDLAEALKTFAEAL